MIAEAGHYALVLALALALIQSVVPLIGAALCIFLMKYLDGVTWIRFGIWLAIGMVIYFTYSRKRSLLNR